MATLTLNSTLNTPFSTNSGSLSSLVPVPFDVSINGHAYVADLSFKPWKREAFRWQSVAMLRAQADSSNVPGEASLNPEGLWRRTAESWHHGAGQVHYDRKDSDLYRFRSSKGINVWTQWQATLLSDTTSILSSANTDLKAVVCGSYLYVLDGQALKYTATLAGGSTAWTTVTGTPAVTPSSITADGGSVYVAYGASGVYSTAAGTASATQYVTSAIDAAAVIGFVMGRLMLGSTTHLYNIIATGALPTALLTSNYSSFVWTGFAEGQSVIYAAGNSGDQAAIYRIGITSDGTVLSAPVVAGNLPRGETINAIYGYVGGQIAIGTNLGWRFAEVASTAGDLTIGPLNGTAQGAPTTVACFAGYDRFIYFGWTDYDSTSTGLGRMDPSVFPVTTLVPAFASDLMVTAQGTVSSVVVFGGTPVLAVSGSGFYSQTTTPVATGTIDSGLISYDIVDNKVPVFLDVSQSSTTAGTITSYLSLDSGAFGLLGTSATASTVTEWPASQVLCRTIEVREVLTAASNISPILVRHTLRSVPAAVTPTDIYCVIRLDHEVLTRFAQMQRQSMWDEFTFLDDLRQTKSVVPFQAGTYTASVTVEDIDMIPEAVDKDHKTWGGVAVVRCRTVV